MTRAKVVHIITKLELGGAQQNTLFTVEHLNRRDFRPYLLAGPGGELFDQGRAAENFQLVPDLIREVRPLRDLRALLQIKRLLREIRSAPPADAPVIVHTHSSKAGIIGRLAARLAGIPIIIHSIHGYGFHGGQLPPVRLFYIFLERLIARATTCFIAVARANIDRGIALKIFPAEKVRLIRSGIDIKRFASPAVPRQEMRRRLGIPDDSPLALMVACLKPQKAPLAYVQVCARISAKLPKARFLLAGDGVLRPAVEEQVRRTGLENAFRLLGWQSDIPSLLHASDALVLTSRWEGLPRVIPQAMSAGIPVVVTRVDGSPEAVRHDETGYVLEPGDVSGIAHKTLHLLENPEIAHLMGRAGRELVAEFDIHAMVARQEELYRELLSGVFFRTG